jgi:predicted nucleic acid-binding protein
MIFIDTGALIGRYLSQDQHHENAIRKWEKIQHSNEKCFTSNFVLDELFTLLARWTDYEFAAAKAHNIYASAAFKILRPDQVIEEQAIELFLKFSDQKISFTDCVSFVLMKQNKIKRAFSFDRHFVSAGFSLY